MLTAFALVCKYVLNDRYAIFSAKLNKVFEQSLQRVTERGIE